jgi:hypothetical protein
MVVMTFSLNVNVMIAAQGMAGAAGAALVPSLVALIADRSSRAVRRSIPRSP